MATHNGYIDHAVAVKANYLHTPQCDRLWEGRPCNHAEAIMVMSPQ